MLHNRFPFQFTCLDHGTPGDKLDKWGPQLFCKSWDDCMLKCFITIAVADNPCEAGILPLCEALHRPSNVVCSIDTHKTARTDEINFFCKPFADRHREFTTYDVTEDIVNCHVDVVGRKRLEVL